MSSPLTFFRRNQKLLLAVFGVLIMLTFVVGDYISRYQGRSTGQAVDTTVVTWKGGKIDERELWMMRDAHNRTVRFLDLLVQKTLEAGGRPRGLGVNIAEGRVFDPGIPRSYAEEDLVQTALLARKAQDLGVRFSDRALDEFLDSLTDGKVDRSEFGALLKEATQNMFDRSQLFDQLRIELSAQHMRMMAGSGVFAMSPALAWDAFNRLNRRVKAELLPVAVADFESKVTTQPTEDQIQTLYDEGKDRYPSPDSPEAGFKRRRKIAFQYLKADFDKFLQAEMATVTKEQIQEYYEKNKNDFKVTEAPPAGTGEAKPAEPSPAPAADAAAKPEAEPAKPAPAEEPAAAKPAGPPTAPAADAAATPEAKPAGAEAKEPAAEPTLNAPASGDAPAAPAGEPKQSRNVPRRDADAFAFVSYNAAEDAAPAEPAAAAAPAEPAAAPPAGEPPAAPAAPAAAAETMPPTEPKAEPVPEPAAKPETPPAPVAAPQEPAPESAPAEAAKEPAKDQPKDAANEEPKEQPKDAAAAPAPGSEPPVKYKPLAEVEDEIRRNVARAPAQDKATAALKAARAVIDKHFRDHASWQANVNAKTKTEVAEPTPPDNNALAKSNGLVAGETPAVDELEIGKYELGKAFRFSFAGNQFRRESFAEIAYTDRQPLYKSDQIRSFEVDVEFLYWKTKDEEPFVPELKDVREEVVRAWKLAEAYRLAKAEAEKMAKDLPADKPLKESLPEAQAKLVLEPAEFTWLTRGSMPMGTGAPMLNSVPGVDLPGHDFMRAVFALKPGQIGTAANAPQTTVYVVRLASESPDEDARRKQFIEGGLTGEMGFLARVELQTFLSQWYRDLGKEMDVHWVRPPQAMQMVE